MKILFLCIFIVILFVIFVIADSIYLNRRFQLVHYDLKMDRNSSLARAGNLEVKVVFLTDLHGQTYGGNNQKLLDAIQKQKPDLILIGGDMFVKEPNPSVAVPIALIKELVKIAPVFYANGNHEKKVMEYWEESKEAFLLYKKRLEDMGVKYLINDSSKIICKGSTLEIIGLDLGLEHYRKVWHKKTLSVEELQNMVQERTEQKDYRILLAHNPQYFERYEKLDVDLVLSGHVHGGIAILPLIGGVIAPDFRLFPKYDFGKFESSDATTTMVLSKGLGVHSLKFRFFNVPEVSVLHIEG